MGGTCAHSGTPPTVRVCHIASGDRWAGAEAQLSALLKALRHTPGVQLSAVFLNEGRLSAEARQLGIDLSVFDESRHSFVQILSAAKRFLAGKNIQVLHSHRYKENLLAALLARRFRAAVHVSSQHGAPEPFQGWRALRQSMVRLLDLEVALHGTDRIISVSDELRGQLMRNIPASKIVTIRNGIDEQSVLSCFSAQEAKRRLGMAPDCPVVGTVGRLDPIKRLDIFLLAAKRMSERLPDARFVIAGNGTEAASLGRLAANLGLNERVLFLGHRDDIYDVIRAMDIFVLCSDHEGLPMALLETLYLGVPVVARPVGGIAEVIQDGVEGLLVRSAQPEELASACLALLREDGRRRALASAGAALVAEKFTSRRTAAQTLALYRSLVKSQ